MIEGISDSMIASVIGQSVKYVWHSDLVSKIRYYITNPNLYCRYNYLKKYNRFEYNLIDIKKLIFNKVYSDKYFDKIDYVGHGKNYLNFNIKDSSSTYILEIINDVEVDNFMDEYYDGSNLTLNIRSTSPSVSKYRSCKDIKDLKIINHISYYIEKEYNIKPAFESYELVASGTENIIYPRGNVFKEEEDMNQIIYNEQSIAIKSGVYDDLINCLDNYKFKLFKNKGD